jgi:hypothetical protein
VLGVLADVASHGLAKPEPFGTADLFLAGTLIDHVTLDKPGQRETYTPAWEGPPMWSRVPLGKETRIRVHLIDRDLAFDDEIGTAELNSTDLTAAFLSAQVYHVRVAEQTNNQILFIGISVVGQ